MPTPSWKVVGVIVAGSVRSSRWSTVKRAVDRSRREGERFFRFKRVRTDRSRRNLENHIGGPPGGSPGGDQKTFRLPKRICFGRRNLSGIFAIMPRFGVSSAGEARG